MSYTNKALASRQSISVLHDPAPGWHHLPSLLSHASVYLPSHPFQTIPHSHFATFFFFYLCYSQLGISVSPYLFMEILKFFSLIGQLQCIRCSAGGAETQRERWLAVIWVEWLGWRQRRYTVQPRLEYKQGNHEFSWERWAWRTDRGRRQPLNWVLKVM